MRILSFLVLLISPLTVSSIIYYGGYGGEQYYTPHYSTYTSYPTYYPTYSYPSYSYYSPGLGTGSYWAAGGGLVGNVASFLIGKK